MIKFEKVSFKQYLNAYTKLYPNADIDDNALKAEWEEIKLPKRGTSGSAGYDFFAPADINVPRIHEYAYPIPTGIRFVTDRNDVALLCYPRSGQGFKFGIKLCNTVGVIDSDYCNSDNEGHIMVKLTSELPVSITAGTAFMQGIITPFITVDDDCITIERNGGFGSTDKENK